MIDLQKSSESKKTLIQLQKSYSLAISKLNENRDIAIQSLGAR